MNRRNALTLTAVLTMLLISTSASALNLGELVEQESLNWVMGKWTATTDQGAEITLVHRWTLDKNAIAVNFTMGDYKYQSMIIKMPGYEDRVIEGGADNQGNMTKSEWAPEGENLVCTSTRYMADGEVMTTALVYSKVNWKTMKVAMYTVENGTRSDTPWTVEFKRQPRQPKKTTEEK